MAVITLDWRETGSANVRRTFNSIFQDAQRTRTQVDQLGRSLQGLGNNGVRVNTGDSDRRITSLSRRAQELRQRLRDVSSQRINIQVQSSGFREFSQSVAGTSQQLTAVQQRLVQYQQANAQLANSFGLPIASVRQLNTALGTLPGQTARVVSRYTELRSAGESSVRAFQQLNTEFGISRGQFDALQASVGLSTQALTALTIASGAVATAIGGIFQGGASNFLAFERSLQGAAIRAGESREGFSNVADEVRRLGAETAFTAPQVAAVTDQLSRIGFTVIEQEQALDGFIRTALSSGEDISTVTQVVASALRQFNIATTETGAVGDLLSTAANRSNVSVGSLGESLRFVAPVARQANQSLEETVLALSLLGDNALRGGVGGRNLARALEVISQASAASTSELAELSNGNENAIGALQRLGTNTRDAAGNFLPLFDVLEQVANELDSLQEQTDREVLLSALGGGAQGGRAIGTLIRSIREAPESVEILRNELDNARSTAAQAAEEFQRGLPGAVVQIQSAFEGLQIRFFEEFQQEAELIVRSATNLIRTFLDLPQPIQSAVIATTALTGVLAGAIAIIAGYQLAVQTLGLANINLSVSTVRAQAAQAAQTAVSTANTAAARSNAIAQINVATALNGIAAASGRAVAGLGAQTAALRANAATSAQGFASTLSGLQLNVQSLGQLRSAVIGNPFFQAGVYAGVAGAIIAVADTFNEVTEAARETDARTRSIQEALGDVARARQAVADSGADQEAAVEEELAQNAELAADRLSRLQQVFDQIRTPINAVQTSVEGLVQGFIDLLPIPDALRGRLQALIDIFPQQATAAEAAANRQAVAFGRLIEQSEELLDSVNQDITAGADSSVLESQLIALRANIAALEAERPTTEQAIGARNAYLEILRQTEQQLQANISGQTGNANAVADASDQVTESVNDQAAAFDNLFRSVQDSLNATDADELGARAELEEEKARLIRDGASIDAINEVNQRIFDSEQSFNNDRIQQLEVAKQRLDELTALDPNAANANAEQIADIDTELRQLRIDNAQAIAENVEQTEERALEALRRSFDEQAALVEANAQDRARALIDLEQNLLSQGQDETVIRATVELQGIDNARAQLNEQIALERQRRDAFAEGTDDRAQAVAQIDQLETQLRQNALDGIRARQQQEEAAEDARIEAIEREEEAATNAINAQAQAFDNFFSEQERIASNTSAFLDGATAAIDAQNSALERRAQLLDAQTNLQGAIDNSEVQGLERALEIRQQLSSEEELSNQERRALERELQAITGSRNTSERRIQQELLEAEQTRRENALASLNAQQALEAQSLVLDQERERIAAQRAVLEAEISGIQARAAAAALQADRDRLAIQERSLRSQLATSTDPEEQAQLQQAITENQLGQDAAGSALVGAQNQIELQDQAVALRQAELAQLAGIQAAQREQLALQQSLAQFELAQSQAAEARATATELAAEGSSSLLRTATANAEALERQRDAAEATAAALLRASQASSNIGGGGTATLTPRREGGPVTSSGGPYLVGEAPNVGPELGVFGNKATLFTQPTILNTNKSGRIYSPEQTAEIFRQQAQINPAIARQIGINPLGVPKLAGIAQPIFNAPAAGMSTAAMEAELVKQSKILSEIQEQNLRQSKSQRLKSLRGY